MRPWVPITMKIGAGFPGVFDDAPRRRPHQQHVRTARQGVDVVAVPGGELFAGRLLERLPEVDRHHDRAVTDKGPRRERVLEDMNQVD